MSSNAQMMKGTLKTLKGELINVTFKLPTFNDIKLAERRLSKDDREGVTGILESNMNLVRLCLKTVDDNECTFEDLANDKLFDYIPLNAVITLGNYLATVQLPTEETNDFFMDSLNTI